MDIWHKTPHPTAAWCLSWSDCFLRKCWHHRLEIKPHKLLSALQLTERYCCFINMSSHHPSVYLLSAALLISSKKQLFWCVCVCLRVCVFVLSERWGGNIQCVWCVGVGGKGGVKRSSPRTIWASDFSLPTFWWISMHHSVPFLLFLFMVEMSGSLLAILCRFQIVIIDFSRGKPLNTLIDTCLALPPCLQDSRCDREHKESTVLSDIRLRLLWGSNLLKSAWVTSSHQW